jgi:hypothetical protein
MKKFRIALPVLAFAVAIAASAFTAQPVENKTSDTMYFWFHPTTGAYLGQRTLDQQEAVCPGEAVICANGYDSKTSNNQPVGPITAEAFKD